MKTEQPPMPPMADTVAERGTPEWGRAMDRWLAWFRAYYDPEAMGLKDFCDAHGIPTRVMGVDWPVEGKRFDS